VVSSLRTLMHAKALETLVQVDGLVSEPLHEVVENGKGAVVLLLLPPGHGHLQRWLRPQGTAGSQVRSQCERDMLTVLKGLEASPERRFVRAEIVEELERLAKTGEMEVHGECTIRKALARLVALGLLVNDRDRRGYGLV
jgi:hypothetical protein